MYENEEIEEKTGRDFAKEIGAIFKYTSAKNSNGVDELFRSAGNKFIDPNWEENVIDKEKEADLAQIRKGTVRIAPQGQNQSTKKKEGGCC
jgi:hypothetical protein